jgi:uncharacterized glyoxalase superfamily protein PhnB
MTTTTQRIITILVYADIAAAHDFLVDTFGFSSGGIHRDGDGQVVHGEISLDGETIWLHRVAPECGLRGVAELGAATGMIIYPPTDQPYGQREYSASDSEGRIWSFATRT